MLTAKFPRAAELMATAREDVPAFRHFPNDAAITHLVGAVLLEQDEHRQLDGRCMVSLDAMAAIPPSAEALPETDQKRAAMP